MASILYVLDLETEGLVVRVALNGVDVFNDWEGARRIAQSKLNPYVIEGSNALEVFLTPMTDDAGSALDVDRVFRLALYRGEHGALPDDTSRIASYTWRAAESPVEPGVLTGVWGRQFTVSPALSFGRWTWQDAPAVAPREEDARELMTLAEILHGALARRDAATVMTLTDLRTRELARALDLPVDEVRDEQASWLSEFFASPAWALEPFDPGSLAASPYARGRLVRITDAYGAAPIKGTDGERPFAFAFAATRVDGLWAIAR